MSPLVVIEKINAIFLILVDLKFSGDYASLVSSVGKETLEASIAVSIATSLSIDTWRVSNLVASAGSIAVTFDLLPALSNETSVQLQNDVDNLQLLVSDGSLEVTLTDGSKLSVNTTSLASNMFVPTSSPPTNNGGGGGVGGGNGGGGSESGGLKENGSAAFLLFVNLLLFFVIQ